MEQFQSSLEPLLQAQIAEIQAAASQFFGEDVSILETLIDAGKAFALAKREAYLVAVNAARKKAGLKPFSSLNEMDD